MRIAFLACPETLPGSPRRRADAFEHDVQFAALAEGLAGRAELTAVDWRAPLGELAGFDQAILGSPWDYIEAKDEFLARLDALEVAGVMVRNPAAVVRWNADKLYLRELEQRGAPSIATIWADIADAATIAEAFESLATERVVIKRRVGAGGIGQASFTRGDPALAGWSIAQPVIIQPFLPAIQREGEFSFIFIAGGFSHALIKRAAAGDYRIQSLYGGIEVPHRPAAGDLAAAAAILALLPFASPPLYARIDMVRRPDGALALMEAELIEPYLYPEQGPELGSRLAAALLEG